MALFQGLDTTDKPAVVLDLGSRYTKFGFVGEFSPRCIIPSEIKCPSSGLIRGVHDYKDREDLYALLVEFIHRLYFRHALVTPKDRHVVIVESLLSPTLFRDTLAKVLFCHFEVSSILFVPYHLVVLCGLGIRTALVIDVGFKESQVIPIYEGVPVLTAWEAQPLGSQAVENKIKENLIASFTEIKNASGDAGRPTYDIEDLSSKIIEDIKVRTCFTTTLERGKQISDGLTPPQPPTVNYRLGGDKLIKIPGWIRESSYEVIFERDNDQSSLPNLILDSILKCSIDCRKPLAENLLLVGGTSMAPGFKYRLMEEVRELLKSTYYNNRLSLTTIKIHTPPSKENYSGWLGGAIFGATDMIQMRALTRNTYLDSKIVPDWSNLSTNSVITI